MSLRTERFSPQVEAVRRRLRDSGGMEMSGMCCVSVGLPGKGARAFAARLAPTSSSSDERDLRVRGWTLVCI